jgi:hypothetical protein
MSTSSISATPKKALETVKTSLGCSKFSGWVLGGFASYISFEDLQYILFLPAIASAVCAGVGAVSVILTREASQSLSQIEEKGFLVPNETLKIARVSD